MLISLICKLSYAFLVYFVRQLLGKQSIGLLYDIQ